MDDSERSYGYSEDIYHGRRGPGGHYGRQVQDTDSPRFYPRQPHFEPSYESAGGDRYGYPRQRGAGPHEEAITERQGPGVPEGGAASHRYRADLYEHSRDWVWDVEGPFRGRGPKGYRRSDERIYEDVCDRLEAHGRIDASDVEVAVEDAEVTLSGTVSDRRTKRTAEDVVDTVRGVFDVHNRLTLEKGEDGSEN